MTHYDDIKMPKTWSFSSGTGPKKGEFPFTGTSGYTQVNQLWAHGLRRLELDFGTRLIGDLYEILEIFEVVGTAHTFLIRDWNDWNTTSGDMGVNANSFTNTDAPLQNTVTGGFTGDGTTTTFQPFKRYTKGSGTYERLIRKVDQDTNAMIVAVDGTPEAGWTYSLATGILTFSVAPANATVPTWGGDFWLVGRFVSDEFLQNLHSYQASELSGLSIMEARLA